MMPKRVKFRKSQRGKMRGNATRGNTVAFGEFGLQALVRRQRVCPFCGGHEHRVVARKHGVVRIRRCETCCLYFTDPIYRSQWADLYDSLYRAEGSTTRLPDAHELAQEMGDIFLKGIGARDAGPSSRNKSRASAGLQKR